MPSALAVVAVGVVSLVKIIVRFIGRVIVNILKG